MRIEFNNATIAFPNGHDVFRDFSLTVESEASVGKIVAILGNSGVGKSTLLKVIADSASRVSWLKRGTLSVTPHELTSYLPQQPVFVEGKSVAYNLSLLDGVARSDFRALKKARERYIELLNIEPLLSRSNISELSGGERQRVMIARTLAFQPRAVLLDEPMTSLDPEIRAGLLWSLRSIIRNEGILGIYITHDVAEAFAYADEVIFFAQSDAKVISGPHRSYETAGFFSNPPNISAAYFLKSPFFVAIPVDHGSALNADLSADCRYIGFDSRGAVPSLEQGDVMCKVAFCTSTALALTTEPDKRFLLPMTLGSHGRFSDGSVIGLKLNGAVWQYDVQQRLL